MTRSGKLQPLVLADAILSRLSVVGSALAQKTWAPAPSVDELSTAWTIRGRRSALPVPDDQSNF